VAPKIALIGIKSIILADLQVSAPLVSALKSITSVIVLPVLVVVISEFDIVSYSSE
jgi:hypothetical protein